MAGDDDEVISGRIEITGAAEAIGELQAVKGAIDSVSKDIPPVKLEIDASGAVAAAESQSAAVKRIYDQIYGGIKGSAADIAVINQQIADNMAALSEKRSKLSSRDAQTMRNQIAMFKEYRDQIAAPLDTDIAGISKIGDAVEAQAVRVKKATASIKADLASTADVFKADAMAEGAYWDTKPAPSSRPRRSNADPNAGKYSPEILAAIEEDKAERVANASTRTDARELSNYRNRYVRPNAAPVKSFYQQQLERGPVQRDASLMQSEAQKAAQQAEFDRLSKEAAKRDAEQMEAFKANTGVDLRQTQADAVPFTEGQTTNLNTGAATKAATKTKQTREEANAKRRERYAQQRLVELDKQAALDAELNIKQAAEAAAAARMTEQQIANTIASQQANTVSAKSPSASTLQQRAEQRIAALPASDQAAARQAMGQIFARYGDQPMSPQEFDARFGTTFRGEGNPAGRPSSFGIPAANSKGIIYTTTSEDYAKNYYGKAHEEDATDALYSQYYYDKQANIKQFANSGEAQAFGLGHDAEYLRDQKILDQLKAGGHQGIFAPGERFTEEQHGLDKVDGDTLAFTDPSAVVPAWMRDFYTTPVENASSSVSPAQANAERVANLNKTEFQQKLDAENARRLAQQQAAIAAAPVKSLAEQQAEAQAINAAPSASDQLAARNAAKKQASGSASQALSMERARAQAEARAQRAADAEATRVENLRNAEARRQRIIAGGGGDRGIRGGGPTGPSPSYRDPMQEGNRGALNLNVTAKDVPAAEAELRSYVKTVNDAKSLGQAINLKVNMTGGPPTEAELIRLSTAARTLSSEGNIAFSFKAVDSQQSEQLMAAIRGAGPSLNNQKVQVSTDVTGINAEKEANDAARAATNAKRESDRAAAVTKRDLISQTQEQTRALKAATAAERESLAAQQDAENAKLRPFGQTAQTQSRSLLGVPVQLAAPAALGIGVGASAFEAAGYQTMITQVGNQTNLTTEEIGKMSQSIRDIPSGTTNLAQLAQGFKNITDLGYSAGDAQTIFGEESKAATASGADQASVMLAITSSMKDYNAQASDVAKFTNTTVEAARLANSSFETWSDTTRRATAIAAAYGIPLQEVDAALVALTRHGFNTAQANTQVAGLLQNIIAPTPTAQKEIQKLTAQSGVDLVGDFSQEGIQQKGLGTVLSDIGKTTSDAAEIRKLIPALRGGQAALILSTVAAGDFNHALGLLGQTADGSLKPVDEALARIQQTVGYKLGQSLKDLKIDLIDIGGAFLPIVAGAADFVQILPSGLTKAVIEAGLLVLAAKTLAIGIGLAQVAAARFTATMAAEATAGSAQNAVLAAQNKLLETNAALKAAGGGGSAASLAADAAIAKTAAVGTAEKVVIDTEAVAGKVGTTGLLAGIGAAVSGALAAIAPFVIPVTLGLAAGKILSDAIFDPIANARAKKAATKNPDVTQADEFVNTINAATDPQDAQNMAQNMSDSIDQMINDYNDEMQNHRVAGGTPFGGIADFLGFNKITDADIKAIVDSLVKDKQKIADEVAAKTKGTPNPAFDESLVPPEKTQADLDALATHYAEVKTQRDQLLAEGAPERLVNLALNPEDFSQTPEQLTQAKKDLTEWESQYQKVQTAAKDAETALASVDVSKGLAGLAGSAEKLQDVNLELDKVGMHNSNISALADLTKSFKELTDQETAAMDAYNGYLLTLDGTDARITLLETLKKRLQDASDQAQAASENGTATDDQRAFLQQAPNEIGNVQKAIDQLKAGSIPDITGLVKTLPDQNAADQRSRAAIIAQGGGQEVVTKVRVDSTEAMQQIHDIENGKYYIKFIGQYGTDYNPTPNNAPLFFGGDASTTSYDNTNGDSAGPTQTPNGDARNLQKYAPQIQTAAAAQQIPSWLLAAIVEHESSGVAGIPNNSGSGALGLTQVIPSGEGWSRNYTPEQIAMLKGSGPQDVQFQLDQGAKILREFLNANGQDPKAALAAYGGGDPGYYGDLEKNYKIPIENALYGGGPGNGASGGGSPFGAGGNTDAVAQTIGQQIVQKALSQVGQDKMVAYCQQWVEETVQAITGQRGATGRMEGTATSGFQSAQQMGLVTKTPQPGDLVYYPDANGGDGHVAIYAGLDQNGQQQQISTWDKGAFPGNSGPNRSAPGNPSNSQIHIESVGPGAQFVSVTNGGNPQLSEHQQSGQAYSNVLPFGRTAPSSFPTSSFDAPGGAAYNITPMYDATGQARVLGSYYKQMPEADQARVDSETQKFGAYAKTYYEHQNPTNIGQADQTANSATLNFAIALSKAMLDAHNNTAALVDDYAKLHEVAGPVADIAIAYVQTQTKINQATDINLQAQKQIKAIDEAAFYRQYDRQDTARQIAADDLKNSRANEDADIALAAKNLNRDRGTEDTRRTEDLADQATQKQITIDTFNENYAYSQTQRTEQDKQRALQFNQSVQGTELQNQIVNTQRDQQNTVYNRTSQEQVVAAAAKGAGSNLEAGKLAGQLGLMHDADTARQDADKKAIDDLQMLQQAQTRKDNLDSYNLETETLKAQRAHEDELHQIDIRSQKITFSMQDEANRRAAEDLKTRRDDQDQALRTAADRLARKRGDEDAMISLQNLQAAQDKADAINKKNLQDTIDQNNDLIKGWQEYQTYLDGVQSSFYNIAAYAGSSANSVAQMLGNPSMGDKTPVPIPPKVGVQVPAGSHYSGTPIPMSEALSVVGDGPQGQILPTTEIISRPGAGVTPITNLVEALRGSNGGPSVNMPVSIILNNDDWESELDKKYQELKAEIRDLKNRNNRSNRSKGIA